jgi:hypothetical protein
MAQSVSHSHASTSTPSLDSLPTLSRKAEARAAALQLLVDDLKIANFHDPDGDARLLEVFVTLQDGAEAER